jgi:UDP-N-acetylglucosamine 2-epimerase
VKVIAIVGTRPEAIKMAPVIASARLHGITVVVCATAQHREMLDQVLDLFSIRPDHDLDLMRPDQTLASLTARAIAALDRCWSRRSRTGCSFRETPRPRCAVPWPHSTDEYASVISRPGCVRET